MGTIAHDLKNPLAVILGRSEMLTDMIDVEVAPKTQMRAQVDAISNSTKRLIGMINSLMADAMNDALDITLRREPIDLSALAREVCEANQPLVEAKEQSLNVLTPEPVYVCGDNERLREAIDNLVSNAVKYSFVGGAIELCVQDDGTDIVCAVTDHGPGLSLEDASRLFGRYQRLSAKPTGGESSTGLGLSIVRRIVELHGGRAEAHSAGVGTGSTFLMRFPKMSVGLI